MSGTWGMLQGLTELKSPPQKQKEGEWRLQWEWEVYLGWITNSSESEVEVLHPALAPGPLTSPASHYAPHSTCQTFSSVLSLRNVFYLLPLCLYSQGLQCHKSLYDWLLFFSFLFLSIKCQFRYYSSSKCSVSSASSLFCFIFFIVCITFQRCLIRLLTFYCI